MLSRRKGFLFLVLCIVVTGAFTMLGGACVLQFGLFGPEAFRPLMAPIVVLGGIAWFTFIVLGMEYAQALRGAEFNLFAEAVSLSHHEFVGCFRWCPSILTRASLGLGLIIFLYNLFGSNVSWSSNEPLTLPVARSFLLFMAPLFLLPLPVIVSGFRVPGSFSEQLAAKESGGHGT